MIARVRSRSLGARSVMVPPVRRLRHHPSAARKGKGTFSEVGRFRAGLLGETHEACRQDLSDFANARRWTTAWHHWGWGRSLAFSNSEETSLLSTYSLGWELSHRTTASDACGRLNRVSRHLLAGASGASHCGARRTVRRRIILGLNDFRIRRMLPRPPGQGGRVRVEDSNDRRSRICPGSWSPKRNWRL